MSTKTIKQIIKDFFKGTNFQQIDETISLEVAWKKIVGQPIINNTKVENFINGKLIIKVANPIWRNEIFIQKNDILKKMQKKCNKIQIKDIILK